MKKLIITLICVAVVASGTFGAYKINESRKSKNAVAKVALVSNMMDSYWGDDLELYGSITEGNVQNVMLDDEKLVEEDDLHNNVITDDEIEEDTADILYTPSKAYVKKEDEYKDCLLYTSPSPRDS